MHWSSLPLRITTTGVIAAVCVLVTTWGPQFESKMIPRTRHPVQKCGSWYRFSGSSSIVNDVYWFTGPGALNTTKHIPRDDWSPHEARRSLPEAYTRYIQDEFGDLGWPQMVLAAGWPLRCASYGVEQQFIDRLGVRHGRTVGAIVLPAHSNPGLCLALPGIHAAPFLANMIVFTIPIEAARNALHRLRERRRARRGHCPRCNYSLEGISAGVCPECGHPRPDSVLA